MKKLIITIAGNNGSGKSTASRKVAEILGYQKMSTGDFMRQMAKDRGVTLDELSALAEKDPSIDIELDNYNKKVGEGNKIVIDSRLGFHFIPEAFKVFLQCNSQTAAIRVIDDATINPNRHNETRNGLETIDDVAKSLDARLDSERKRYRDLYGISDHTDPANFDLVIDTALPENNQYIVPEIIIKAYKKWLNN